MSLAKGLFKIPTKTYFNLHKEKQEKIFQSAFKEFSRVPYNEASISNIIKKAKIPRGSFYQYFEDKEDLFFYIIKKIMTQKKELLQELLVIHDRNVFKVSEAMFLQELEVIDNKDYRNFFKNLFLNLNHDFGNRVQNLRMNHEANIHEFINQLDLSQFKRNDLAFLKATLHLLGIISKEVFVIKLSSGLTNEEALELYKQRIEIVKYGVI